MKVQSPIPGFYIQLPVISIQFYLTFYVGYTGTVCLYPDEAS